MHQNLPTELLRHFIEVVECGSMLRASAKVNLSQSALSLQMKRLAEVVQSPIFQRHRSGVILTPVGEALATYARAILELNDKAMDTIARATPNRTVRVGIVQDFAALLVSGPLARFRKFFPDLNLRVKIGVDSELTGQFEAGLLDIIVLLGEPNAPSAVGILPLTWMGDRSLGEQAELPLAVMDAPCPFRDRMVEALERAGRPYRIALETPGIAVLGAAINSGLGLSCRSLSIPFVDDRTDPGIDIPVQPLGLLMRCAPGCASHVLRLREMILESLARIVAGQSWAT